MSLDRRAVAEQDRHARCRRRTRIDAARMIFGSSPFGEDDALGITNGAVDDTAHDAARAAEPRLELVAVALEVDELARDAARDGGPRDRRRDPQQHARVEREGDQVVRAEMHVAQTVQRGDRVGHVLLGEERERARRRHLHLLVDLRGAHVERAAEDEREAEDVVDLIRDSRCVPWRRSRRRGPRAPRPA